MPIWFGLYKPGLVIFLVVPWMMRLKLELSIINTSRRNSQAHCQKRCLVNSDVPVMLAAVIRRTFLLWVLNYLLVVVALDGLESCLVPTMKPSSFGNGTAMASGHPLISCISGRQFSMLEASRDIQLHTVIMALTIIRLLYHCLLLEAKITFMPTKPMRKRFTRRCRRSSMPQLWFTTPILNSVKDI